MTAALGMFNLVRRFEPSRRKLAEHAMYDRITSVDDMRVFMQHHVFAVWDFMSLLKALQRHVTGTETAWRPIGNAATRRLVNEMVLEEESDEIGGEATSHFDLYRRAMRDAGADVGQIDELLRLLASGFEPGPALEVCGAPAACRQFVRTTFAIIATGKPHVIAAAFTFGREDAIPGMFGHLVATIPSGGPDRGDALGTFKRYLDRHIELDGGSHASKSVRMLADLCGDDLVKWDEAADAAIGAVTARLALWDGIAAALDGEDAVSRPGNEVLAAGA